MSPFERAAKAHAASSHPDRSFTADIEAHFVTGFVFSTPDYFIMGRPVFRTGDPKLILDPWHRFPWADCDCWMVWLAAGDLGKAWTILPWPLPWLGFERGLELRFVPAEAMKRLSLPSPNHEKQDLRPRLP